jgi:hypothetical protein
MTTGTTPTEQTAGTLNLWRADDGSVEVLHHFGGTEPCIEIRKAGEEQPVQVIKTTRFWRVEQREAIERAQRLANGEPLLALTDADPAAEAEPASATA